MNTLNDALHQVDTLDELAERDSPLHRLHPLTKLLLTLFFLVSVTSCPNHTPGRLLLFLIIPMAAARSAQVPGGLLLKRLAAAMPFALFAAVTNLLFDAKLLFYMGPLPVTGGMLSSASILLKTLLSVGAVLLLVSVTPVIRLVSELTRLGVPEFFCLQFFLTFRYLSVLLETAGEMHTAYVLRTGRSGGIRMQDMGFFLGQLLLKSYDRAGRVFCAMKCRGYSGSFRVGRTARIPGSERLLLLLGAVLLAALRFCPLP